MGYSGKKEPKTHLEHVQALVGLNLFDDARIELSFNRLIKTDFCTKKPFEKMKDEVEFNPFSLEPQVIGQGQVLTSTVMHAITMVRLVKILQERKNQDQLSMLDVGCGLGYSTILYADLASQILKRPFEMCGTDFHENFIEHCHIQKDKYPVKDCNLQFIEHDFLEQTFPPVGSVWGNSFDICTFGFEVSLDLLRAKQSTFKTDAHLIVPLSCHEFDLE